VDKLLDAIADKIKKEIPPVKVVDEKKPVKKSWWFW
jgi:hypothetical protein